MLLMKLRLGTSANSSNIRVQYIHSFILLLENVNINHLDHSTKHNCHTNHNTSHPFGFIQITIRTKYINLNQLSTLSLSTRMGFVVIKFNHSISFIFLCYCPGWRFPSISDGCLHPAFQFQQNRDCFRVESRAIVGNDTTRG